MFTPVAGIEATDEATACVMSKSSSMQNRGQITVFANISVFCDLTPISMELNFRDLKTTMGMDILRCKTPEMIEKEILMHFITYNCVRSLIAEVARKKVIAGSRISFKGSMQALRQWEPHLNQNNINNKERIRLIDILYNLIADYLVPDRPGRSEPRAVKRRQKPYQLLTSPRAEMKVESHRGRKHAKAA